MEPAAEIILENSFVRPEPLRAEHADDLAQLTVGMGLTRFGAITAIHRRAEIGWTFVNRPWQRSAVNSAAKLLLLEHGFERLGYIRIELKIDARNETSRAAILRIGATEEGTLRRHIICADGFYRDTVYFSILDTEWPEVRARLAARLNLD